ncbi:hypothetical protein RI367_006905 [Sorochytrium milnesiophthora]
MDAAQIIAGVTATTFLHLKALHDELMQPCADLPRHLSPVAWSCACCDSTAATATDLSASLPSGFLARRSALAKQVSTDIAAIVQRNPSALSSAVTQSMGVSNRRLSNPSLMHRSNIDWVNLIVPANDVDLLLETVMVHLLQLQQRRQHLPSPSASPSRRPEQPQQLQPLLDSDAQLIVDQCCQHWRLSDILRETVWTRAVLSADRARAPASWLRSQLSRLVTLLDQHATSISNLELHLLSGLLDALAAHIEHMFADAALNSSALPALTVNLACVSLLNRLSDAVAHHLRGHKHAHQDGRQPTSSPTRIDFVALARSFAHTYLDAQLSTYTAEQQHNFYTASRIIDTTLHFMASLAPSKPDVLLQKHTTLLTAYVAAACIDYSNQLTTTTDLSALDDHTIEDQLVAVCAHYAAVQKLHQRYLTLRQDYTRLLDTPISAAPGSKPPSTPMSPPAIRATVDTLFPHISLAIDKLLADLTDRFVFCVDKAIAARLSDGDFPPAQEFFTCLQDSVDYLDNIDLPAPHKLRAVKMFIRVSVNAIEQFVWHHQTLVLQQMETQQQQQPTVALSVPTAECIAELMRCQDFIPEVQAHAHSMLQRLTAILRDLEQSDSTHTIASLYSNINKPTDELLVQLVVTPPPSSAASSSSSLRQQLPHANDDADGSAAVALADRIEVTYTDGERLLTLEESHTAASAVFPLTKTRKLRMRLIRSDTSSLTPSPSLGSIAPPMQIAAAAAAAAAVAAEDGNDAPQSSSNVVHSTDFTVTRDMVLRPSSRLARHDIRLPVPTLGEFALSVRVVDEEYAMWYFGRLWKQLAELRETMTLIVTGKFAHALVDQIKQDLKLLNPKHAATAAAAATSASSSFRMFRSVSSASSSSSNSTTATTTPLSPTAGSPGEAAVDRMLATVQRHVSTYCTAVSVLDLQYAAELRSLAKGCVEEKLLCYLFKRSKTAPYHTKTRPRPVVAALVRILAELARIVPAPAAADDADTDKRSYLLHILSRYNVPTVDLEAEYVCSIMKYLDMQCRSAERRQQQQQRRQRARTNTGPGAPHAEGGLARRETIMRALNKNTNELVKTLARTRTVKRNSANKNLFLFNAGGRSPSDGSTASSSGTSSSSDGSSPPLSPRSQRASPDPVNSAEEYALLPPPSHLQRPYVPAEPSQYPLHAVITLLRMRAETSQEVRVWLAEQQQTELSIIKSLESDDSGESRGTSSASSTRAQVPSSPLPPPSLRATPIKEEVKAAAVAAPPLPPHRVQPVYNLPPPPSSAPPPTARSASPPASNSSLFSSLGQLAIPVSPSAQPVGVFDPHRRASSTAAPPLPPRRHHNYAQHYPILQHPPTPRQDSRKASVDSAISGIQLSPPHSPPRP